MRIRRMLAAVLGAALVAAGTLVVAPPAAADHCSGQTTPPSEYSRRGTRTAIPMIGYTAQHGSASDPFAGVHYADGYVYADASDTDKGVVIRAFIPFWPMFVDLYVVGGPGAGNSCAHPNVEVPDWLPIP